MSEAVRAALAEAQLRHPLDLAARVAYMVARRDDAASPMRRAVWVAALDFTRNGYAR